MHGAGFSGPARRAQCGNSWRDLSGDPGTSQRIEDDALKKRRLECRRTGRPDYPDAGALPRGERRASGRSSSRIPGEDGRGERGELQPLRGACGARGGRLRVVPGLQAALVPAGRRLPAELLQCDGREREAGAVQTPDFPPSHPAPCRLCFALLVCLVCCSPGRQSPKQPRGNSRSKTGCSGGFPEPLSRGERETAFMVISDASVRFLSMQVHYA